MTVAAFEGGLPHVASYRRELRSGLDTLFANALDWEHLPVLHASSFTRIECLEQGDWGWRARIGVPPEGSGSWFVQELRLDRALRRWIGRTLEGANAGAEVWTHAFPLAPQRTEVIVDFFQPGVAPGSREALGRAWCRLWERLYDEDERVMMGVERERPEPADGPPRLELGALEPLLARLPLALRFGGRGFRLVSLAGELVVHATTCPHRGASLADCPVQEGRIACPFHGYVFDVRTGGSCDGHRLRLARAPRVVVEAGRVALVSD